MARKAREGYGCHGDGGVGDVSERSDWMRLSKVKDRESERESA
jgi:hypothetical protein